MNEWKSMCGEIGDNDGMMVVVVDCIYIVGVTIVSKGL